MLMEKPKYPKTAISRKRAALIRWPLLTLQLFTLKRLPSGPTERLQTIPAAADTLPPGRRRLVSWNVGFGAYDPTFSFFLDKGPDGQRGRYARAQDETRSVSLITGWIETLKRLQPAHILLQEIDRPSARSFGYDQCLAVAQAFPEMSADFAANAQRPNMPYPWHDPIGRLHSGLLSLAADCNPEARRLRLPRIGKGLMKLIDLDRCALIESFPLADGRNLQIIHVHLSAFDEAGRSRQLQQASLSALLQTYEHAGDLIILAGDFNQEAAAGGDHPALDFSFLPPSMAYVPVSTAAADGPFPTSSVSCRASYCPLSADAPKWHLDHAFASKELDASAFILDTQFQWSDHNPLVLDFTLPGPV